jgi:putative ABC transport system substrate-binding protein
MCRLARPGGNATGLDWFGLEVTSKRLELLHELVPKAVRIAVLVNPGNAQASEATLKGVREAANALGLEVLVGNASTSGEIDAAFAAFRRERAEALFVATNRLFAIRRVLFATLAARDGLPTSYDARRALCQAIATIIRSNSTISSVIKLIPVLEWSTRCRPINFRSVRSYTSRPS